MNARIAVGALLLCAALVDGCGAARPTNYYQLSIPGAATPAANADPYPVELMVGPILASHLYREDHIVYGIGDQSMGVYMYQRWSEPPTEMIREVLVRDLRDSNHFRSVNLW